MNPNTVAAIAGSLIGLAGGVVGTWMSIRNAKGPKSRAFIVRMSAGMWLLIALLFGLLMSIPRPYSLLIWPIYGICLGYGIRWGNRRLAEIEKAERDSSGER